MRVLFIKDLAGYAKKGEIKDAREGYATNYLIPKGFVEIATAEIVAKVDKELKVAQKRKEQQQAKFGVLKTDLEKQTFAVKVKVGDKGQVFGGVHEKDIIKIINGKMKTNLDKNQIDLDHPIKEIGIHTIKVKLGQGIDANVKIEVKGE